MTLPSTVKVTLNELAPAVNTLNDAPAKTTIRLSAAALTLYINIAGAPQATHTLALEFTFKIFQSFVYIITIT